MTGQLLPQLAGLVFGAAELVPLMLTKVSIQEQSGSVTRL